MATPNAPRNDPGSTPPADTASPAYPGEGAGPAASGTQKTAPAGNFPHLKTRPAAPPASPSEAEIMEAVAGKLTGLRATRQSVAWLSGPPKPKPAAEPAAPEPDIPPAADPGPVAEPAAAEAIPSAVAAPPPGPAMPPEDAPSPSEPGRAEAPSPAPVSAAFPIPPGQAKVWVSLPLDPAELVENALLFAVNTLGWTLAAEAALLIPFGLTAMLDNPGPLQRNLLGILPVAGIGIAVAGHALFRNARKTLDELDRTRNLPAGADAGQFIRARQAACRPALAVLGLIVLMWLWLGAAVWFPS